jgi:hypothetical protein
VDKRSNNLLSIGVLALLSTLAAGIAHWSMASDIGVTPDSLIYLSAADRLAEGKGLTPIGYHFAPSVPSDQSLVIFPPAYSVLLASTSLFTSDRLAGAKYIHSFLFSANVFLLGLIIYVSSRSIWPALCAMGLFQTSFPLLSIYTMARAEPLFIFFLLSTSLGIVFYIRRSQPWLLVACGGTAAGALMTRYVGVVILLPLVLTVFIQSGPLRERAKRALLVGGVALLPLAGLIIRNKLVSGSSTLRSWAFHFIGLVEVRTFVDSLMLLITPHALPGLVKLLPLTLASVGVVYSLWIGVRGQSGIANRYIRFFSAVTISTYVIFLAAYNSLANPAVDLGPRVALPVYVFGMIYVFSLIEWESAIGKRRALFRCLILSSSVLFMANLRPAIYWTSYRHREGEGFTSRAWRDSETVKFLKALPTVIPISSNAADACYLFTNREVSRLPAKYDPTSASVNADFPAQMEALRDELNRNHAVVIYFDRITWRWYLPTRNELEDTYKLPVATRLADGVVYGAQSETVHVSTSH